MLPVGSPRAEAAAFITAQRQMVGELTRAANISLD